MRLLMNKHIKVIGLLTPYTGENFGDGAIQEAVIHNLKRRIPEIVFYMFSLNPSMTSRLHGIRSKPITGLYVASYSNCLRGDITSNLITDNKYDNNSKLKLYIKSSKLYQSLLKNPWNILRGIFISFIYPGSEWSNIIMAFSLLRKMDMLIVSGGGQIDDYWGGPLGHPYNIFKWSFLAKLIGVKVVFLSVGVCDLKYSLSLWFFSRALKISSYRSYRDEGSKNLLFKNAYISDDKVVPDLAFSYPLYKRSIKSNDVERKPIVIGVSAIVYKYHEYWPEKNDDIFNRYITNLISFTQNLLSKGYQIVLFSTDEMDENAIEILKYNLLNSTSLNNHIRLKHITFKSVNETISAILDLDFVIVSRLHGVILSHLCEKPTIAISYDRKVKQHMNDMDQNMYCIDIENFQEVQLTKLFYKLIDERDKVKLIIKNMNKIYKKKLDLQYKIIEKLI